MKISIFLFILLKFEYGLGPLVAPGVVIDYIHTYFRDNTCCEGFPSFHCYYSQYMLKWIEEPLLEVLFSSEFY